MKRFVSLSVLVILVLLAGLSLAGIPRLINYQGMLTDNSGNPLSGSYNLTFKIYGQASGGSALWTGTHNGVSVQNGLFNVILGSTSPIPSSIFDDTLRYLGITVGVDPELSPRIRLISVGYAYRAQVADSAAVAGSGGAGGGWVDAGATVRLQTATDKVGIGTTSPNAKLEINGNNSEEGLRVAWGSTYPTLYGEFKHSGSGGLKINANAGGGWADMSLQTDGTTRLFIESGGNIGIGTTTPGVKLQVIGGTDAAAGTQNSGYQIIGSSTASHIAIDDNEIMQKASGTTAGKLYIQNDGGVTAFGGNVGIGTGSPGAKLEVSGDLKVTGAYTGAFPRPAYNSGWITINPNTHLVIIHNVGGNVDDYVVDLQFKDVDGVWGINNVGMGSDKWVANVSGDFPHGFWSFVYHNSGACWTNLTSTSIKVVRQAYDAEADQIRVRIWVVK